MSAKNIYHDAVIDALKADGWTITADPLTVMFGGRRLYVDMAAEAHQKLRTFSRQSAST